MESEFATAIERGKEEAREASAKALSEAEAAHAAAMEEQVRIPPGSRPDLARISL